MVQQRTDERPTIFGSLIVAGHQLRPQAGKPKLPQMADTEFPDVEIFTTPTYPNCRQVRTG
jgi:hypothetical protein